MISICIHQVGMLDRPVIMQISLLSNFLVVWSFFSLLVKLTVWVIIPDFFDIGIWKKDFFTV